jgi:hypothetical protein
LGRSAIIAAACTHQPRCALRFEKKKKRVATANERASAASSNSAATRRSLDWPAITRRTCSTYAAFAPPRKNITLAEAASIDLLLCVREYLPLSADYNFRLVLSRVAGSVYSTVTIQPSTREISKTNTDQSRSETLRRVPEHLFRGRALMTTVRIDPLVRRLDVP